MVLRREVPPSASQRKLGNLRARDGLGGKELQGSRVIYISTMASGMESGLVCRHCHSNNNNNNKKCGMVSRISMERTNKKYKNVKLLADPRS